MRLASSRTKKERRSARKRGLLLSAACVSFIASVVLLMNLETPSSLGHASAIPVVSQPSTPARTAVADSRGGDISAKEITISEADLDTLSARKLIIPVGGVASNQLHDSFYDSRSEGRVHQALDIIAPRDAPVLATDDGVVAKLHQSDKGGTTLYESDNSGLFVYYYGHLSRYADGIFEGKPVKRGEVIAYVGDTGNAGPGNYHLHFAISRMSQPGRWSGGEPINPYPLLAHPEVTPSIGGR